MLIVLEGVDKAGKSTLAQELQKLLKWPVIHFGKPGPNPADEYGVFLKQNKGNYILDRFYVGELIYAPLLRNKHSLTATQKTTIERLCRSRGTVLIHVAPDYKIIEKRLNQLGDDMINNEQNKKAYNMFHEVMPFVNIQIKCKWDGTGSVNNIAKEIVNDLLKRQEDYELAQNYCTGIGTTMGKKIVLIGEKLNKKVSWLGFPFDNGSASEFLQQCLPFHYEKYVYAVNSDTIKEEEVRFLISTGPTSFISLGKKAEEKCDKLGINHKSIPHPQYWKRFKFARRSDYTEMLYKAMKEANVYNENINGLQYI